MYNIQNTCIKQLASRCQMLSNINLLFTLEEHLQKSRKANGSNGIKGHSNGYVVNWYL